MTYIELYSKDQLSYFREVDVGPVLKKKLGFYSNPYEIRDLVFRESGPDDFFEWHVAPCSQYIVYLSGRVEIQASGGETRIFGQGDILLANDTEGKGHTTRVLDASKALVLRR